MHIFSPSGCSFQTQKKTHKKSPFHAVFDCQFDSNLSCFADSGGYGSYDAGRLAVSCLESLVDVESHLVCLPHGNEEAVKMKLLEQFRVGLLMFLTYAQPPNWLTT